MSKETRLFPKSRVSGGNGRSQFPPLAEQGRIVEKIDRLMKMCDRLEESIASGKGKQTDLLNALMSQV